MRLSLIILISLFSINSFAAKWKVLQKKHLFIIKNNLGQSYKIVSEGGIPKFLEEVKKNPYYTLVIYDAGSAGTTSNLSIQRAIVLQNSSLKYLGDFPYKYIGQKNQPQWNFNKKVLKIDDEESYTHKVIKIK